MNCKNSGGCCMNFRGFSKKTDKKLDTTNWLCDIPEAQAATDFVEVIFKNTRKGYFRNSNKLRLEKGDIVAVESSTGHDIGTVSLTGQLVLPQMKKNNIDPARSEIKRIYRKARTNDLEKYEEAKSREYETMLRARKIAEELKLNMKIGDVEYQGDGNKAIFYYIADERVDFRQLIKVFAENFNVRIEMKQIGARQEAGRIGGIGPCGRSLCCSSWMSSFVSVATSAARYQEISLNPQKLAGQCAKLKCCMNFDVDAYVEAQKDILSKEINLETKDATFYHFKTDVFGKEMQYSSSPNMAANIITLPVERVKEIIALNKQGIKVDSLEGESNTQKTEKRTDYENVVGQDSLTRFDKKKKNKSKNRRNENSSNNNRPDEVKSENASVNNNSQEKKEAGNRVIENRNQDRNQERRKPVENQNGENRNANISANNRNNNGRPEQPKENNVRPEQGTKNANNANRNNKNNRKQKPRPVKPDRSNEEKSE